MKAICTANFILIFGSILSKVLLFKSYNKIYLCFKLYWTHLDGFPSNCQNKAERLIMQRLKTQKLKCYCFLAPFCVYHYTK